MPIKDANGHCDGKVIRDTRRLLQDQDVELAVVCVNPARLYKLLASGEVDIAINVSSTKALQGIVDFVEPAYLLLELVLIGFDPEALEQPASVAAIRGYDYVGYRQKYERTSEFVNATDGTHASELFLKKRAETLLTYRANFVSRKDVNPDDFFIQALTSVPSYFIVSRQSSHRQWLKQALRAALIGTATDDHNISDKK